ncbi:uncharacterized protein B0T23DRAFT_316414 [Neurospora hispaniola]|uniref:BTB domain-containing protein n=1 Tax=Neurospora hispaniola TaxID=588809 RepID=A0AAJ0I738_9PEZI|nr:hypothetical protein B0T23DRAFT_316414 [Neurospora hispaniola]
MDSEPAIIETVPDPDLVLIVGPSKERIPVELAILKATSPVFASMLSPPWLEAQSKEISLPEDDPNAMRFITLTLSYYNEHELVTKTQTPQEILQIAIAVDKYDLCAALKFALDYLLRDASKRYTAENDEFMEDDEPGELLVYLCAAAYVLGWCEWFSRFALDLICCHRMSFITLMDDVLISSIIPDMFFGEFLNSLTCHEDGICSALLSGIGDLRVLLHEDISWFKGDCPQDGKPHHTIIQENSTFSHMVQRESSHLYFCLRDLKIKENCYVEHARLTLA